MKKKIAFFDFDGTITKKDTLLEFIKFSKGDFGFFLGFFVNSPYLIAYKLKIISNQVAKEKILRFFFRKTTEKEFNRQSERFSAEVLPHLIRPDAVQEIIKLQNNGVEIVIVSASPENWIRGWAGKKNLKIIASELEIEQGFLSGKIKGKNCHGIEKVNRIKKIYDLSVYEEIYAYGDTKGDIPMLSLAHKKYMKPFRK